MAVSSDQVRLSIQAGDGVEVDHDFQFKIFSKTDLKCWKESAAGVKTLGVVDVDYTVAFSAANEGGTVTWAVAPVASGRSIVDGSEMAFTQGTEFPRDTAIPNSTYRNAFDRLTILAQQLSDSVFGRAILWDEELYLDAREQVVIAEAPVDRRAMVYERNSGDEGWDIVPSDNDIDAVVAATAASAAAALASQVAAAASEAAAAASAATTAAIVAAAYSSGLWAARPVAPATVSWYYATDNDSLEMWVPAASRWFLIG
jgi:hypothetical protein